MDFGTLEVTYVHDAGVECGWAPIGRTNMEIALEAGPYTINLDVATNPPSADVIVQPGQKSTVNFAPAR